MFEGNVVLGHGVYVSRELGGMHCHCLHVAATHQAADDWARDRKIPGYSVWQINKVTYPLEVAAEQEALRQKREQEDRQLFGLRGFVRRMFRRA